MTQKQLNNFWKKVKKTNTCWLWSASASKAGYGRFQMNRKLKLPHRISWEIHNGDIPKGLCILHKCDNPRCVNPDHLFIGTHKDNTADMIAKNRKPSHKGELTGTAKLTKDKVLEIKEKLNLQVSGADLAKEYKVSKQSICDIKHGRTWGYL